RRRSPDPGGRSHRGGGDRVAGVGAAGACRRTLVLEARRTDRGLHPCAICAGDLFRWAAAENSSGWVSRLPAPLSAVKSRNRRSVSFFLCWSLARPACADSRKRDRSRRRGFRLDTCFSAVSAPSAVSSLSF